MGNVVSDKVDDCVRIRLSNGATNNLTTEVLREVALVLDEAEHSARGIMLCGGNKFFSNGVDLDWALAQSTSGMRALFLELGGCILKLMESPLPIVGVAKGYAIVGRSRCCWLVTIDMLPADACCSVNRKSCSVCRTPISATNYCVSSLVTLWRRI